MTLPQRSVLMLGTLTIVTLYYFGTQNQVTFHNGMHSVHSPNWGDWLATFIKCLIVALATGLGYLTTGERKP